MEEVGETDDEEVVEGVERLPLGAIAADPATVLFVVVLPVGDFGAVSLCGTAESAAMLVLFRRLIR